MPSVRGSPPSPSRSDASIYLRARVYSVRQLHPVWKVVQTQIPSKRKVPGHIVARYPWVEGLFEGRFIQPFIHETLVTLRQNQHDFRFLVFCQNHLHLSRNYSVRGNSVWRGDIVVMRLGAKNAHVVNMQPDDAARVDNMVEQFVHRVKQRTPFRLPKNLHFCI